MITNWRVVVGSPHTVQVSQTMSGEVVTTLDNREILHRNLPRGDDLDYPFKIDGKPCSLRILYKLERFGGMATMETWHHELLVDGVTQYPEKG
ncbi:MAG TPA: hypothetical protein PKK96_04125 [Anaerolineales bacterium]|nr:hypothetical protein [Anaerolineales bacterium]HMR99414.1 hypothetical protein [Anaerolineales bacterium]HNQ95154.1 hypothetical protein [Anaerolineales bacterium]HNS60169.1 hypothetical protein [Anaerolineales bacterium]